MKFALLLLCAGRGRRLSASVDKAFVKLGGYPLFFYSYRVFASFREIAPIVVVARKKYFPLIRRYVKDKRLLLSEGGEERYNSVWKGLSLIQDVSVDYVIIHDAARPFITRKIVETLLRQGIKFKAAVPVLPVSEAIKKVKRGRVESTVIRDGLYTAQTPQIFEKEVIIKAHNYLRKHRFSRVYDDAQLVESTGCPVKVFAGSRMNIKITYPEDMSIAKAFISESNFRW